MKNSFLVLLLLASGGWACQSPTSKNAPPVEEEIWPRSLDLLTGMDSLSWPRDTTVNIAVDPVFKTAKVYQGMPLAKVLAQLLMDVSDTSDLRVSFVCVDGYAPDMPLSRVLGQTAVLARRDATLPAGQDWPDSLRRRFAPFYLVWPNVDPNDHRYAWPYGVFEIRINTFAQAFGAAYPHNNPTAQAGFKIFQQECMKCHAVNQVGGVMGPEFNHPKNISTYWRKEDLWAFAKNPQSYRISSTMPAQTELTRADFEKIYAYLRYMRQQPLAAAH